MHVDLDKYHSDPSSRNRESSCARIREMWSLGLLVRPIFLTPLVVIRDPRFFFGDTEPKIVPKSIASCDSGRTASLTTLGPLSSAGVSPFSSLEFCLRTSRLLLAVGRILVLYKLFPDSEAELRVARATQALKVAQDAYTGDGNTKKSTTGYSDAVTTISPSNVHSPSKTLLRQQVYQASSELASAEQSLRASASPSLNKNLRAASIIVNLCRKNGGCYTKVGQHLANLDYLLPAEVSAASLGNNNLALFSKIS